MTPEEDAQLEILKASHDNVQSVLRFLDTKAGLVFAFAGVSLAGLAKSEIDLQFAGFFPFLEVIHLVVFSALVAIFFAVVAVWPSYGPREPDLFSWLYPCLHPSCYRKGNSFSPPNAISMTSGEVLAEFQKQLTNLSQVLLRKTKAVRRALMMLFLTVVFFGLHLVLQ